MVDIFEIVVSVCMVVLMVVLKFGLFMVVVIFSELRL